MDLERPVVMGHEFCAEVVELGPNAGTGVAAGDRIVSIPVVIGGGGMHSVGYSNDYPGGYGELMALSAMLAIKVPNGLSSELAALTEPMAVGRHAVARSGITKGKAAVVIGPGGMQSVGYSNDYPGGYGELMALSAMLAIKVPNGLSSEWAALTEPMAVGLHAVVRSGIAAGQRAVVVGCGPVGLAVIAALRVRGVESIVAADFSPARRTLAATMGATEVVDPRQETVWDRAGAATPLVVFEAVGVPGVLDDILRCAPARSRVVVVGVCMGADTVHPYFGISKELSVDFVLGYTPEEFAASLRSIAEGEIDVAPLVTARVGLEGLSWAFDALGDPEEHCKIVVEP
jgi:threonine dehydrogenase-like Zn-dependent dehydrogenase